MFTVFLYDWYRLRLGYAEIEDSRVCFLRCHSKWMISYRLHCHSLARIWWFHRQARRWSFFLPQINLCYYFWWHTLDTLGTGKLMGGNCREILYCSLTVNIYSRYRIITHKAIHLTLLAQIRLEYISHFITHFRLFPRTDEVCREVFAEYLIFDGVEIPMSINNSLNTLISPFKKYVAARSRLDVSSSLSAHMKRKKRNGIISLDRFECFALSSLATLFHDVFHNSRQTSALVQQVNDRIGSLIINQVKTSFFFVQECTTNYAFIEITHLSIFNEWEREASTRVSTIYIFVSIFGMWETNDDHQFVQLQKHHEWSKQEREICELTHDCHTKN